MRQTRGLHVVLLGPDGSGKSTVIARLHKELPPVFRQSTVFHGGPGLLRRNRGSGPVTEPHAKAARPLPSSIAKVVYWLADYSVGYYTRVRPKLTGPSLVLFDRYLPDVLVDPARYRYGGPLWLVNLAWHIVPKPDLVILLDASPEVIQARKREVAFDQTARQCSAYRTLVQRLPYGHIVDASQSIDCVVADINDVIATAIMASPAVRQGRGR